MKFQRPVSMVKRVYAVLKAKAKERPLLANAIVYGTMYSAAEFSQQTLILQSSSSVVDYDWTSIRRYGFLGTFVFPQYLYFIYGYMDRHLKAKSHIFLSLKKLAIDQFCVTPLTISIFFIAFGLMEQRKDPTEEFRNKFLYTYLRSFLFWIPAQSINFFFLPPSLRVVWVAACSFVWINVLCIIKRKPSAAPLVTTAGEALPSAG